MAVCPSCGAAIEGGVCPHCAASGERPAGPAIDDNIASALCYLLLGVTGTLLLLLEPYRHNRRVRFHAFQAIFVNLAIIVVWFAISLLGRNMALLISPVFLLVVLVLWVVLIWTAWQNERIVLPLIGHMAEKQA
ncbi:MAG: hypothetical protein LAP39_01885 [Acidobacteriia bacterium]|nr:hypothetical protein [Terriglobia bacterium]